MISPADCGFLADICRARAGLDLDPQKPYLIGNRLAPLARRESFSSLADLVRAVRDRPEERLAWAAVEALAPSETAFFRDQAVFARLAREILPERVRARGGERARVFSLGCGSGQEVYSLAMIMAENPELSAKVELFGSDLSEQALERAQAGLYSQFEVQRGLPAQRLVRHFEKRGEMFGVAPRIRKAAAWRRANLMDDLTAFGRFDLVLCRYVLSALAPAGQATALKTLSAILAPGGLLMLGLEESAGHAFRPHLPELGLFTASGAQARAAA